MAKMNMNADVVKAVVDAQVQAFEHIFDVMADCPRGVTVEELARIEPLIPQSTLSALLGRVYSGKSTFSFRDVFGNYHTLDLHGRMRRRERTIVKRYVALDEHGDIVDGDILEKTFTKRTYAID